MNHSIVQPTEAHYPQLWAVVDAVARERKFLWMTQMPPYDEAFLFYEELRTSKSPHFIALDDAGDVVGWIDVSVVPGETRSHIGVLGMGLVPLARGQGLGRSLLRAVLAASWQRGLTRVELGVRADNVRAIALYEQEGFEHEGVHRAGVRFDGEYFDVLSMALLSG